MPGLLSGSILRSGGSGEFIKLPNAQPQLPPSPSTSTGYTLVTDSKLRTTYRTSLGNMEMTSGTIFSNIPDHNITLAGTGTGVIVVTGGTVSTSTNSGALIVEGGIGISRNIWTGDDIEVNGLLIGQGWGGPEATGYNNIAIRGKALPIIFDEPNGQETIAIGYDVLVGDGYTGGLETSYKSIALGRYALNSGTGIENTIAIGDSALKNVGTRHVIVIGALTTGTATSPVTVTVLNNGLSTGTEVTFSSVGGMEYLNNEFYYVKPVNADVLELYIDVDLLDPLDGTAYPSYTSGGVLSQVIKWNNNIAIGTQAGINFFNGEQNFFLGDNIAQKFTTGSYNLFIGHDVANNMTNGNANISIGGDNLVDGVDNQINIGSVLYYNGGGFLVLNSDTGVGLGTESTSTISGAFNVYGGAGVSGNLYVGGTIYGTATTATNLSGGKVGSIPIQSSTGTTTFIPIGPAGTVLVSNGTTATWTIPSASSSNSSTNADNVFINTVVPQNTYYLALDEQLGLYSPLDSDANLTYVTTLATTSSYYVAGTSVLNVPGSIYTNDGNIDENNLLYTPRVTITTGTAPADARVGDFWIDSNLGALMQYWVDGTTKFWIQISTIG
jgi:hypothetical protein